jgi:hypothetical protein
MHYVAIVYLPDWLQNTCAERDAGLVLSGNRTGAQTLWKLIVVSTLNLKMMASVDWCRISRIIILTRTHQNVLYSLHQILNCGRVRFTDLYLLPCKKRIREPYSFVFR